MLLSQGIRAALYEEVVRTEHYCYGMFVLAIMTHGEENDILFGSDNLPVKLGDLKDILSKTNFPAMEGKPKLIIIQACSGGELYRNILFRRI